MTEDGKMLEAADNLAAAAAFEGADVELVSAEDALVLEVAALREAVAVGLEGVAEAIREGLAASGEAEAAAAAGKAAWGGFRIGGANPMKSAAARAFEGQA